MSITRNNKTPPLTGNGNDNDKVWVTITRTINTGNYENIKIEAGYSKTYFDKDDPLDVMDEMCDEIMLVINSKEKSIKNE